MNPLYNWTICTSSKDCRSGWAMHACIFICLWARCFVFFFILSFGTRVLYFFLHLFACSSTSFQFRADGWVLFDAEKFIFCAHLFFPAFHFPLLFDDLVCRFWEATPWCSEKKWTFRNRTLRQAHPVDYRGQRRIILQFPTKCERLWLAASMEVIRY